MMGLLCITSQPNFCPVTGSHCLILLARPFSPRLLPFHHTITRPALGRGCVSPTHISPFHHTMTGPALGVAAAFPSSSPLFTTHHRASFGHCGRVSPTIPLSPHHHRASVGRRGRVSLHFTPFHHTMTRASVGGCGRRFPLLASWYKNCAIIQA